MPQAAEGRRPIGKTTRRAPSQPRTANCYLPTANCCLPTALYCIALAFRGSSLAFTYVIANGPMPWTWTTVEPCAIA